jgi:hypothetical protein
VNRTEVPSRTASAPRVTGWSSTATMVAFTAIAAVISYNDGLYLIRFAGALGMIAYLYPLLPDGLIFISSVRLYRAAPERPRWAMAGIILGIGLTLAMNIGAGVLHNWMYALADACVPVVFYVALEILRGSVKRGREGVPPPSFPAASTPAEPDTGPDEPLTPDEALLALLGTGSRQAVADLLGVPKSRVNRWHARLARTPETGPEEPVPDSAAAYWDGTFETAAGASQGHVPAALNGSAHGV